MSGLFIQLLKLLGVFFVYGGIVLVWIIVTNLSTLWQAFIQKLLPLMKQFDVDKK